MNQWYCFAATSSETLNPYEYFYEVIYYCDNHWEHRKDLETTFNLFPAMFPFRLRFLTSDKCYFVMYHVVCFIYIALALLKKSSYREALLVMRTVNKTVFPSDIIPTNHLYFFVRKYLEMTFNLFLITYEFQFVNK